MTNTPAQIKAYSNYGKHHGYPDKLRQSFPNVGPGMHPNHHNLLPNLQNLNPNMQSSPNLTHVGSNAPNLSLNFQNLSPIPSIQSPTANSSISQIPEYELQRINPSTVMPTQYVMLLHNIHPKVSPVGSIASQRPLSQLSSHNVNKHSQNYGVPENPSALHTHFQKPIESSQSMHNLSKSAVTSSIPGVSSIPDQNQNMKSAVSSGNLAVGSGMGVNNANKQNADQRLTHEQFRAALQMVVCIFSITV